LKASRERLLMGLMAAGVPLLVYLFLLRPSLVRMKALHARIRDAEAQATPLRAFTPVSMEERTFLEDPEASWRTRIPRIVTDGERLAHVNRVVSAVNAALKAKGVGAVAMRATWDPVKADFTLPPELKKGPPSWIPSPDAPEYQMSAWVLEVEIPGATEKLFKALASVPSMGPLMEPVGVRWGEDHQYLLLRNYYLR